MGNKYFCWNIDDGLEQDKKIINILQEYEMGATFNLNAGFLGKRQMIGRIGNLGVLDVPCERFRDGAHMLKYHENNRIPADEVAEVYRGFEIASHGYRHENLKRISNETAQESIQQDVSRLSQIFGQEIRGFAYPYGVHTKASARILKDNGIVYARTCIQTNLFQMPKDLLHLPITGWHTHKGVLKKLERFIQTEAEEDLFFLMFAHGYEFDFDTEESNWDKLKQICDMVRADDKIICCSTGQALLK